MFFLVKFMRILAVAATNKLTYCWFFFIKQGLVTAIGKCVLLCMGTNSDAEKKNSCLKLCCMCLDKFLIIISSINATKIRCHGTTL